MKDAVLKEPATKWLRDAKPPEISNGSPDAALGNALEKGVRIGLEKCAGDLLSIIKLLGND